MNEAREESEPSRLTSLIRNILDELPYDESVVTSSKDETSKRLAVLWTDLLSGTTEDAATCFKGGLETSASEYIVFKEIAFYSLCEHHFLPFFGTVDVLYRPSESGLVAGAATVARAIGVVSKRLQLQERLTNEIAHAIYRGVDARGVLVVTKAHHLCMSMRERRDSGTSLTCLATEGTFALEGQSRFEAMQMIFGGK
ncbi:MAG: GTP cyclohydrolase I [Actinomycetota bacterium]|nr:GTP cyclohydrolase I [Actinomycetota bacterium]